MTAKTPTIREAVKKAALKIHEIRGQYLDDSHYGGTRCEYDLEIEKALTPTLAKVREALTLSHGCATLRDAECGGCPVSDALALLREEK